MRRLTVLVALLLLAAPRTAQATRGRLVLSLFTGGGYASDPFVGAGLGSDGFVEIAPSARLDLSLAPRWKLATAAEVSYGHYFAARLSSLFESFAVEGRWLAGEAFEASLLGGVEHGRYSEGVPFDAAVGGTPISSTLSATASPLARLRALGLEWRLGGLVSARTSNAAGVDVPETDYALLAGAARRVASALALAVTYKLARDASSRPDFARTAHALFGLASSRLGSVGLEALLQLQTATYATTVREDLLRLTLSASYPLTDDLDLEAAYSFAATHTTDPARVAAPRHLVLLALRWRFAEVRW